MNNMNYSEVTIKDIWPKLCDLGIVELRINNKTVWSDGVLDCMYDRDDYYELVKDYIQRAKKQLLGDCWIDFRITSVKIEIIYGHHCIADIEGYFRTGGE